MSGGPRPELAGYEDLLPATKPGGGGSRPIVEGYDDLLPVRESGGDAVEVGRRLSRYQEQKKAERDAAAAQAIAAATVDRGRRFDEQFGTTIGGFVRGAAGFLESIGAGGEVYGRTAARTKQPGETVEDARARRNAPAMPGRADFSEIGNLFSRAAPYVRRAGAIGRDVAGQSPVAQSFKDVKSAGEAVDYAQAALGNTLGSIAPAIMTGPLAPGAFVTAGVGEARMNLEERAKKDGVVLNDERADNAALVAGGVSGAFDTVLPGVAGKVLKRGLARVTGKATTGAVAAAAGKIAARLATTGPGRAAANLFARVENNAAGRIAIQTGEGVVAEAPTEYGQEILTSGVAPAAYGFDVNWQEVRAQALEAGIQGAIGGGGLTGGPQAAVEGVAKVQDYRADRKLADLLRRQNAAPASPEAVQATATPSDTQTPAAPAPSATASPEQAARRSDILATINQGGLAPDELDALRTELSGMPPGSAPSPTPDVGVSRGTQAQTPEVTPEAPAIDRRGTPRVDRYVSMTDDELAAEQARLRNLGPDANPMEALFAPADVQAEIERRAATATKAPLPTDADPLPDDTQLERQFRSVDDATLATRLESERVQADAMPNNRTLKRNVAIVEAEMARRQGGTVAPAAAVTAPSDSAPAIDDDPRSDDDLVDEVDRLDALIADETDPTVKAQLEVEADTLMARWAARHAAVTPTPDSAPAVAPSVAPVQNGGATEIGATIEQDDDPRSDAELQVELDRLDSDSANADDDATARALTAKADVIADRLERREQARTQPRVEAALASVRQDPNDDEGHRQLLIALDGRYKQDASSDNRITPEGAARRFEQLSDEDMEQHATGLARIAKTMTGADRTYGYGKKVIVLAKLAKAELQRRKGAKSIGTTTNGNGKPVKASAPQAIQVEQIARLNRGETLEVDELKIQIDADTAELKKGRFGLNRYTDGGLLAYRVQLRNALAANAGKKSAMLTKAAALVARIDADLNARGLAVPSDDPNSVLGAPATEKKPAKGKAAPAPAAPTLGVVGRIVTTIFGSRKIKTRYEIYEASDLTPSHSPFTFLPSPKYPEGVQGRDLRSDAGAQQNIILNAQRNDPDRGLDPTALAQAGPPIITKDGMSIAGNGRLMSLLLTIQQFPQRYADYKAALLERADEFGLDPEFLSDFDNPILVRVIVDPGVDQEDNDELRQLNRQSDETETKSKRGTDDASAASDALQREAGILRFLAQNIRADQTIAEFLDENAGRDFLRQLIVSGVMPTARLGSLVKGDATNPRLTDEGKLFVRRMLLAAVLDGDTSLMDTVPSAILNKIERAVPSLLVAQGIPGWGINAQVRETLRLIAMLDDKGMSLEQYDAQRSFDDDTGDITESVRIMYAFLMKAKPTQVGTALKSYAAKAQEKQALEAENATAMPGFEKPVPSYEPESTLAGSLTVSEQRRANPNAGAALLRLAPTVNVSARAVQQDLFGAPDGELALDMSTPPAGAIVFDPDRRDATYLDAWRTLHNTNQRKLAAAGSPTAQWLDAFAYLRGNSKMTPEEAVLRGAVFGTKQTTTSADARQDTLFGEAQRETWSEMMAPAVQVPADGSLPQFVEIDGALRSTMNSDGRPIHPTIEGVVNFWRWFGDSKLVDTQGRPQVVYHGTTIAPDGKAIDAFQISPAGRNSLYGRGVYITNDAETASRYTNTQRDDESPSVYALYARVANPLMVEREAAADVKAWDAAFPGAGIAQYVRDAYPSGRVTVPDLITFLQYSRSIAGEKLGAGIQRMGFDGTIAPALDGRYVAVAYTPAQVKSALANSGEFDQASDSIVAERRRRRQADPNQVSLDFSVPSPIIDSMVPHDPVPAPPDTVDAPSGATQDQRKETLRSNAIGRLRDLLQRLRTRYIASTGLADAVRNPDAPGRMVPPQAMATGAPSIFEGTRYLAWSLDHYFNLQTDTSTTFVGKTIGSPQDAALLGLAARDPGIETSRVFFTDNTGRIVGHEAISSGAVAMSMAAPSWLSDAVTSGKDVIGAVRKFYPTATGFYMMHNHPSGVPVPSGADMEVHMLFQRNAGPAYRGHVIIDGTDYAFLPPDITEQDALNYRLSSTLSDNEFFKTAAALFVRKNGMLEDPLLRPDEAFAAPELDPFITRGAIGEKTRLNDNVLELVRTIYAGPTMHTIVFTDTRDQIRAVVDVPPDIRVGNFDEFRVWLAQYVQAVGANSGVLVTSDIHAYRSLEKGAEYRLNLGLVHIASDSNGYMKLETTLVGNQQTRIDRLPRLLGENITARDNEARLGEPPAPSGSPTPSSNRQVNGGRTLRMRVDAFFQSAASLGWMDKITRRTNASVKSLVPFEPDVEQRVKSSESTTPATRTRLAAAAEWIRRQREAIPALGRVTRDTQTSVVNELLLMLRRVPAYSQRLAADFVADVVQGLNKQDVDLLMRSTILDDLLRDLDNGKYTLEGNNAVPFFGKDAGGKRLPPSAARARIEAAKKDVDAALGNNPKVTQAIQTMRAKRRALVQQLVAADLMSADVLDDERYYHRQVIEYARAIEAGERQRGVRSARQVVSGFQRQRQGGGEFNTLFVEAEFEWVAQAYEKLQLVGIQAKVKDVADEAKTLRRQARDENRATFYRKVSPFIQAYINGLAIPAWLTPLLPDRTQGMQLTMPGVIFGSDLDPLAPFRKRIGMHTQSIYNAANNGEFKISELSAFVPMLRALDQWINGGQVGYFEHPDWFKFLGALSKLDASVTPAAMNAAGIFAAMSERDKIIEDVNGEAHTTWRKLANEAGLELWQPKRGQQVFRALSITEETMDAVLSQERDLDAQDIIEIKAMGGPLEQWAVQPHIAAALDDPTAGLGGLGPYSLERGWMRGMGLWKYWQLYRPSRLLKYNLNNMAGDLDVTFLHAGALKYARAALRDLRLESKGVAAMPAALRNELRMWQKHGAIDSGYNAAEVAAVWTLPELDALIDPNPLLVMRMMGAYWKKAEAITRVRENVLRLATARYFQAQIEKQGGIPTFAASNPKIIRNLWSGTPKNERAAVVAARLSRDLIGDYQSISAAGSWARNRIIPFYSWTEINMKRYFWSWKNIVAESEGKSGAIAGTARVAGALGSRIVTSAGVKALSLAIKVHVFYGAAMLWNKLFWPDEEEKMRREGRGLHVIYGVDDDGTIRAVRLETAWSALLKMFTLEDWPAEVKDLREGNKSVRKLAGEVVSGPLKQLISQWEPVTKGIIESIAGINTYPDPFNPRPLKEAGRDWMNSQGIGFLNDLYRKVMGQPIPPSRPGLFDTGTPWQKFSRLVDAYVGYRVDPGEAAYWNTRQLVTDFVETKKGEQGGARRLNQQQLALYYFKAASRWGDEEKAQEWLREYYEAGGSPRAMRMSVKNADPLSYLPDRYKGAFLRDLSKDERKMVDEARNWWRVEQRAPARKAARGVSFSEERAKRREEEK